MTAKAQTRGQTYHTVWHPQPQAGVIEAEWPIRVEVGTMKF